MGLLSRAGRVGYIAFGAAVFACSLSVSAAKATPGDLDPSFGQLGSVVGVPLDQGEYGGTTELQPTPDGGSVALRYRSKGAPGLVVLRFDQDGRAVAQFGSGGTYQPPTGFAVGGLTVDPDGRVVIVGSELSEDGTGRVLEAIRLSPSGSPDPSFGSAGIARVELPEQSAVAGDATALGDGSILIATTVSYTGMTLVKLGPDGQLDDSFGSDGSSDPVVGDASFVGIGPTGDLFLGGTSGYATPAVARFDPDGVLRSAYGDDGVGLLPSSGGDFSGVGDFVLDGQGRAMAITGGSFEHGGGFSDLNRLDANGDLDQTFDDRGLFAYNSSTGAQFGPWALVVDDQNRIEVAGDYEHFRSGIGDPQAAVARLLPDGALDPTFGANGISAFPERALATSYLTSIATQADGRLLLGGPISLARMLSGPGPADADADALTDADDVCPRVPGSDSANPGCPKVKTRLTIAFKRKEGFSGLLSAPLNCSLEPADTFEKGVSIEVFRVRPGDDTMIGSHRALRRSGVWKLKRLHPHGRFYAKYAERLVPNEGDCRPSRTMAIRVGR